MYLKNHRLKLLLRSTLVISLLGLGYNDVAEAFQMSFQSEIKMNNNDGVNDNLSVYNTSDDNRLSITQIVFTLGANAELDTGSHGSPTINSTTANTHWGPNINSSADQGLTTSLSSLADGSTTLTFDFTPGQFLPGEAFAINIDFDKRTSANLDPVGGDWSLAKLELKFRDSVTSGTDTLSYQYNSGTINSGNKKSFPSDSLNGNTLDPGISKFCSTSNPDTCAYDTLGFSYPYAAFEQPVPFEFSPTIGFGLVFSLITLDRLRCKKRN
jgi:hypothetical protein